ncbi:Oxysterol-binding protein-related protein [Drosera capensis]
MRVKETMSMHTLCCISLYTPSLFGGGEDDDPNATTTMTTTARADTEDCRALVVAAAGVVYKWTNYSKGWRPRWFVLRHDGIISYSRIPSPVENVNLGLSGRLIGEAARAVSRMDSCGGGIRKNRRGRAVVNLKVSWFRESRTDDRKFYVFTATKKTLHLKTNLRSERAAWIEALASSSSLFFLKPREDDLSAPVKNVSLSTDRLKNHLIEDGADESLIEDCEQIMLSKLSKLQGHLKVLCEDRSNLLHTITQLELEGAGIKAEVTGIQEFSTTESSDDIEKQESDGASEEDAFFYYDTEECFTESPMHCVVRKDISDSTQKCVDADVQAGSLNKMQSEQQPCEPMSVFSCIDRRKKLPDPVEKEKGISLWSMIKDNVGKDLTRVCLPVYFNEPLSSLQRCCEDLEYSYLLDRAYSVGKAGDSVLRILNVAAFAVSGYASSKDRPCKPFNPMLGETYEADYPEKGIRFFSEKVSHHPTLIACHCEGRGWKFRADSNLKARFWGQSIQLDPVGVLTLEFDDGETFQWSKVTTSINNLILGKVYCDHHGLMHIRSNRQYSCKLKFKGHSILDRNHHQVDGVVEDSSGRKVASLFGKWDENMYCVMGNAYSKQKDRDLVPGYTLLWERNKPPPDISRYNLTSFATTLNELTPGLQEKLPPTDSRLRPDQRYLENGEFEKANSEKLRLEKRQRMSRKLQENGWKPRWFERDGEDGSYRYVGGYWEAREHGQWDGCPNIFGDFSEEINSCLEES